MQKCKEVLPPAAVCSSGWGVHERQEHERGAIFILAHVCEDLGREACSTQACDSPQHPWVSADGPPVPCVGVSKPEGPSTLEKEKRVLGLGLWVGQRPTQECHLFSSEVAQTV